MKKILTTTIVAVAAATGLAVIHHSEPLVSGGRTHKEISAPKSDSRGVKSGLIPVNMGQNLLMTPEFADARAKAKANAAKGLPTFYGSVIFDDNWYDAAGNGSAKYGFYSFMPSGNITLSPIIIHPNLNINGGGAYSDRNIHYHLWEMYADDGSETGITFHNYFCRVNTDEWNMENLVDYSNTQDNIAFDMTYDPVESKLYAVQWGPFENDDAYFAQVDGTTGESVNIAKVKGMSALACDNFGRIFGVRTSDGMTCYLDQKSGQVVEIGLSGIVPKYTQSATVDPATNIIYWAAMDANENSTLRTINTITGASEKIGDISGGAEITCLFVEDERGTLSAPGELKDVVLGTYDGKSTISAVLPSKAFDGSSTDASLTFEWYIDGKSAGTVTGAPGATVSLEAPASDGRHTIIAQARSSKGEGPKVIREQWCGPDVPAAVRNLTLSVVDGTANLAWEAPLGGLRGGSIDLSDVKYTVVRYPGAETVAMGITRTDFSEKLPAVAATYYYAVTATNSLGSGETAISNTVYTGQGASIPYFQDFESEESLNGFTIINSENDRGWFRWENKAQGFKAMASKFSMQDASDNWLMLPPLPLEAGTEYMLRYKVKVFDSESPEKYEVTIGTDATVEAQTTRILSARTIKNESWMDMEVPFTVKQGGMLNLAFHCVSPAMAYYLIIDDISVTCDAPLDTPKPVTDAKSVCGDDNNITISWTAPTEGLAGTPLDAAELTYRILDNSGSVVAKDVKGNSFVDKRFADATSQKFVYYQIHAVYGAKESEGVLTDFVVAGPDYDLDFAESFAGASLDNAPWSLSTLAGNVSGCWAPAASASNPTVEPYDADGGMAFFKGNSLPAGCEARLTSPKIDLMTPSAPVLSFMVYAPGDGCRDELSVEISHNDCKYVRIADVDLGGQPGWRKVVVPIERKHCDFHSMIAFRAKSAGYGSNICVDAISVSDAGHNPSLDIDLQAVSLTGPDVLVVGEEAELTLTVFNAGRQSVAGYKVTLMESGGKVAEAVQDTPVVAGETYRFVFRITPETSDLGHKFVFSAKVECDGDGNADNNVTEPVEYVVQQSGVSDLNIAGARIYVDNGEIVVRADYASDLAVYTIDGCRVASMQNVNGGSVNVVPGLYMVTFGKDRVKLAVR